ncbi:MAG: hypothetical protein ACI8R4_004369, partial [Paracoccaceae bacterium]
MGLDPACCQTDQPQRHGRSLPVISAKRHSF